MAIFLEGVARDEDIFGPGGGTYVGGLFWVIHTTEGGWDGSLGNSRTG